MIIEQSGAAVLRDDGDPAASDRLLFDRALECAGDAAAGLELAAWFGRSAPGPGSGRTLELWQSLATLAAADPTIARIVEPHLDALAILAEVPDAVDLTPIGATPASTWGVYAAEAAGMTLEATPIDDRWVLTGTKPWCSLAALVSHCLVTASQPDGRRRLFAVRLDARATVHAGVWAARGLTAVPSGPVDFDAAPAVPVGEAGWYLERSGFAWGGIGVAAIWWGATLGIARLVASTAAARPPDQIGLMHLGRIDEQLWAARSVLREAAAVVDGGGAGRHDARMLAARTRAVVASCAERVLLSAAHALGPGPLALDPAHAGRVADLELYLRQHHAERDSAALGRMVLDGPPIDGPPIDGPPIDGPPIDAPPIDGPPIDGPSPDGPSPDGPSPDGPSLERGRPW
ncbi:MAG: hypothetical protein RI885_2025 [Actinomycetota bacterium]